MNWRHHDESLERIACALEHIERILARAFPPKEYLNIMAVPIGGAPGGSDTFDATFVDASGNTVNQAISGTSSDDTIATVSYDGNPGVSVGTVTYVAAGSAQITTTGTNADGTQVSTGTNNPFTVTVTAAVDEGVAVNIS